MKNKILILFLLVVIVAACNEEEVVTPNIEGNLHECDSSIETNKIVSSNYVSIKEAREDLESLLKDLSSLSKSSGSFSTKRIANAYTLKSAKTSISKSSIEDSTAIHVFNFEDDGGFAIMSATRDMPSLLAITDGGNLDTNEVIDNPGLILFLNCLEAKPSNILNRPFVSDDNENNNNNDNTQDDNVEYIVVHGDGYTKYEKFRNEYYKPLNGYCRVHWGQEEPYNEECETKYGEKTVVGCVAVACAQLMSIYKYPTKYKDTTLNWSQMIADTNSHDIAWLMKKLGDSENLDMKYNIADSGGSSTFPSLIPRTLKHFGYANGGVHKYYNSSTVCEELKKGYPVLIGGCDTKIIDTVKTAHGFKYEVKFSGGHRWLAHGLMVRSRKITYYSISPQDKLQKAISKNTTLGTSRTESYEYILCNFGWGKDRGNGYFLSGVFDVDDGIKYGEPLSKSNKSDYFQYEITTITGIRK